MNQPLADGDERELRRDELVRIALRQYIRNGYEGTSVRTIASEAGGGTGLFYHYFQSKGEIYEAALALYSRECLAEVGAALQGEALGFAQKMEVVFAGLGAQVPDGLGVQAEGADPDVLLVLRMHMLEQLTPMLQPAVIAHLERKGARVPLRQQALITRNLLYGASGVLHASGPESLRARTEVARQYFLLCMEAFAARYTQ